MFAGNPSAHSARQRYDLEAAKTHLAAPARQIGRAEVERVAKVGFVPAPAGRLFMPFSRLHAGDTDPGTRIGLSIVQRIVERHGGRVSVNANTEVGLGARFEFTLAAAETPAPSR